MKLEGKKLIKPNLELIVIPRGDGEDIILKAGPVSKMDVFDELCPAPKPPSRLLKGGRKVVDSQDPEYLEKQSEHSQLRFHYMALKSLEMTESLEWETVDMKDPDTWANYLDELRESGFSEIEVNRVVEGVMNANSLNEDRVEEARQRFLAGEQEALEEQSTPAAELTSTSSGEPAKG